MSYLFAGVFTNDSLRIDRLDSKTFVARAIAGHNISYGVLFPTIMDLEGDVTSEQVLHLVRELRLHGLRNALYAYDLCWGGTVDVIEGFQIKDGQVVHGTCTSYENHAGEGDIRVFVDLMRGYDIEVDDDGYFKPFERGFWGEQGY